MSEQTDIDVVSITVTGDLNREVDIQKLAEDNPYPVSDYRPKLNASLFRFEEDGELMLLYTSGKYILRGGDEYDQINEINDKFLSRLSEYGVEIGEASWEVSNIVAVGDIGQKLNLNKLMLELGMGNIEYEPEQFPGLIYRSDKVDCIHLVFASGKVVITGGGELKENQKAFNLLLNKVQPSSGK